MSSLQVSYFTMEIGLSGSIPTFAGGLGVLAADMMQSAADMGVSGACMTVCWKHGYLSQHIRDDGTQEYSDLSWNRQKELRKLPQTVTVQVEKRTVTVGVWVKELQPMHGTHPAFPVYFLDTDLPQNDPKDRAIVERLYGGDGRMRIAQEIVLGIGGVKMLRALGYDHVDFFHLNEGHCAFATLELLRERGFKDEEVRRSCAFTTHTPVAAGHDVFPYDMAWAVAGDQLPWHIKKIAGEDALSMTKLAMNLSHKTFGVSRVHGLVSQRLLNNNAIDYITNGIHHIRWCSQEMQEVFDRRAPGWRADPSLLTEHARDITDEELWKAHMGAKKSLIALVNQSHPAEPFEEDWLTIASARRVVAYKRPELLYENLERLRKIGCGKLQIVHAGNAHPGDQFAMDVIRRMIERSKELRGCVRIAYLPNYNPDLACMLVSGADVWLNTPTRLHEASGTSGMKAALNGVPNLSTLDGWWIEGYEHDPESGWRIGPLASTLGADDTRAIDAEDLYTVLQYEVLPEYRFPGRARWLRRMKRAIGLLGQFNSHRCVQEYLAKAWKK